MISRPVTLAALLAAGLVLAAGCDGTEEAPTTAATDRGTPAASQPASTRSPSPSPTPSHPTRSPGATRSGPDVMPPLHPSVDDYPQGRARIELANGTIWDIPVLLATTNETRAHGLMEVPHVPEATGMVFLFDEDREGGFWMKGTRTDLDIAWFDAAGRVITITTMEVCPGDSCPSYYAAAPYRSALEVAAGWFGQIGLAEGDRIVLETTG